MKPVWVSVSTKSTVTLSIIGMVMAYQAGATLATYGANILIVNLVSIITLRELGPLLTAILVAGRTGSFCSA